MVRSETFRDDDWTPAALQRRPDEGQVSDVALEHQHAARQHTHTWSTFLPHTVA